MSASYKKFHLLAGVSAFAIIVGGLFLLPTSAAAADTIDQAYINSVLGDYTNYSYGEEQGRHSYGLDENGNDRDANFEKNSQDLEDWQADLARYHIDNNAAIRAYTDTLDIKDTEFWDYEAAALFVDRYKESNYTAEQAAAIKQFAADKAAATGSNVGSFEAAAQAWEASQNGQVTVTVGTVTPSTGSEESDQSSSSDDNTYTTSDGLSRAPANMGEPGRETGAVASGSDPSTTVPGTTTVIPEEICNFTPVNHCEFSPVNTGRVITKIRQLDSSDADYSVGWRWIYTYSSGEECHLGSDEISSELASQIINTDGTLACAAPVAVLPSGVISSLTTSSCLAAPNGTSIVDIFRVKSSKRSDGIRWDDDYYLYVYSDCRNCLSYELPTDSLKPLVRESYDTTSKDICPSGLMERIQYTGPITTSQNTVPNDYCVSRIPAGGYIKEILPAATAADPYKYVYSDGTECLSFTPPESDVLKEVQSRRYK